MVQPGNTSSTSGPSLFRRNAEEPTRVCGVCLFRQTFLIELQTYDQTQVDGSKLWQLKLRRFEHRSGSRICFDPAVTV